MMTDEPAEPQALPSAATLAELKQIIRELLAHRDPQPPPRPTAGPVADCDEG